VFYFIKLTVKKIILVLFLLFNAAPILAQEKGFIQGVVLDKEANNEPLVFANVYIKNFQESISTDAFGMYNFNLKPGVYSIVIGYVGYQKVEIPNVIVKANKITSLKSTSIGNLQLKSIELNTKKKHTTLLP